MCIGIAKMRAGFGNRRLSGQKKKQSKITSFAFSGGWWGVSCPETQSESSGQGLGWGGGRAGRRGGVLRFATGTWGREQIFRVKLPLLRQDRNMENKGTDPSLWGLVLLLKAFSFLAVMLQRSGPLTSHLLYVERLVLIARATLEPTGFTASDYNSVQGTPGAAP